MRLKRWILWCLGWLHYEWKLGSVRESSIARDTRMYTISITFQSYSSSPLHGYENPDQIDKEVIEKVNALVEELRAKNYFIVDRQPISRTITIHTN